MTISTGPTSDLMSVAAESFVARQFDRLEGRFHAEVGQDDPRLQAVQNCLGSVDKCSILDLGCGKGRFGSRLVESGAQVVGLDLSIGMLRDAQISGLPVVRGSARKLPFPTGVFDAVIAVEVFQHIPPPNLESVIREAVRVLRAGGVLVVIDRNAAALDPNRPWLPAVLVKRIDELRGRWMYPAHAGFREHWFWPWESVGWLRRSGLRTTRVETFPIAQESAQWIFRLLPRCCRFAVWTGQKPQGGSDGG